MCSTRRSTPYPKVEAKTIYLRVCFGQQACAEGDPLGSIDQPFEDRILHPLPSIFAQASDLSQAFLAGLVASTHIVADEHEHTQASLAPKEGGIAV